jgi:DNA-binding NtrC family response regulator
VVGRARPADVAINDPSLSRQHARFTREGDTIWVEDLGSTNGTRVRGKTITRTKIKLDDEVDIGAVSASVHVLAAQEPELGEMESHDRFVANLEDEVVRARTFNRPLALLMVSAATRQKAQLGRWCPRVRQILRPVDRIALYGPASVMIMLPEAGFEAALSLAEEIVRGRLKGEPQLLCGVAVFPESATSADELLEAVREADHRARAKDPIKTGGTAQQPAQTAAAKPDDAVVVSLSMHEVFDTVQRVAKSMLPVLIQGETGTGKEVVAHAIHRASGRSGPIRCVNCGAIPDELIESVLFGHERGAFTGATQQTKGLFEQADRGTLLLDEIGELSPAAQTALLRVLETKRVNRVGSSKEIEVDVRVVASTLRDLEQMCEAGGFRWDVLYRLNTMTMRLPPLRERPEEILPLAERFVAEANEASGCRVGEITEEARKLLRAYHWPGNVRELRNVLERAVVIAQDNVIVPEDLSERVRRQSRAPRQPAPAATPPLDGVQDIGDIKEKLRSYEAQLLVRALEANGWNQTATAEALEMPLRTLVHKIQRHGIQKKYDR